MLTYLFVIYIIQITSLTENINRTYGRQIFAKSIVENICLLRLELFGEWSLEDVEVEQEKEGTVDNVTKMEICLSYSLLEHFRPCNLFVEHLRVAFEFFL